MRALARGGVLVATLLLLIGCAHHITITPPLNSLDAANITKIDKTVAYYISPADRAKEVTTPGGGGDKVTYLPYLQSEPALKRVLSNVFTKVLALASLDDKRFITDNAIAYIFVPILYTDSSSSSAFTWPPTRFSVTCDCRVLDRSGTLVWKKYVTGEGRAEFSEFKTDRSLAGWRATQAAFFNLQTEILAAKEFR